MYDELVNRLRKLASIPEHCENVADCDECSKEEICLSYTNKRIIEVATQAADAIEGLSHAVDQMTEWRKNPWIPVTEEPPLKVGDDGYCGKCCYGVMTGQNRMFCSAQNCFCEEVFYCEDYEPIVKPITNADRIRSMSDEELAKWMAINTDCFFCKVKNENICSLDEGTCTEEWLWWLKNPAEEGE